MTPNRQCVQLCIPSWRALDDRAWGNAAQLGPADLARVMGVYALKDYVSEQCGALQDMIVQHRVKRIQQGGRRRVNAAVPLQTLERRGDLRRHPQGGRHARGNLRLRLGPP
ncbi:hypothetical protein ACIPMU_31635 [Streptomyces cyaneofuscatus]|uniref:hypothetical protein n=1 Tax=Streptomyces cyaneofuscatus TaxID=66883 RepID=UPI0038166329